jgi:hypothetical protein
MKEVHNIRTHTLQIACEMLSKESIVVLCFRDILLLPHGYTVVIEPLNPETAVLIGVESLLVLQWSLCVKPGKDCHLMPLPP